VLRNAHVYWVSVLALERACPCRYLPGMTRAAGQMAQLVIEANWDAEAQVWVAVSDAIGLVTEADTIDAMLAKLPGMIQDLRESHT
jgi:hypothetical protein